MPAVETQDSVTLLLEACARNVPLDLHYDHPDTSPTRIEPDTLYASTRMLTVNLKQIYLDSAQDIGKTVKVRIGHKIEAFFTLNDTMYQFKSKVTDLNCKIKLNNVVRLVGMCLAVPKTISEAQRREDHRVSFATLDPIAADIHEASEENPHCAPLGARRFLGRVVNLSRGGMAVRLAGDSRFRFQVNRRYYVTFRLPGDSGEFLVLAEARHITDILKGEARLVGFQFQRWPDPLEMRKTVGKISRFLVDLERKLLQNR